MRSLGIRPAAPVSKADAHLLEQFAVAPDGAMVHAGVRRVVVESVRLSVSGFHCPAGVFFIC